jgi:hypothetical protein
MICDAQTLWVFHVQRKEETEAKTPWAASHPHKIAPHKIVVHPSRLCRIIQPLFVMGGTSAQLPTGRQASPSGPRYPPAPLAAPDLSRADSGLKAQEYPTPGPSFLRFAEVRFAARRTKLEKTDEAARLCRMVPLRKVLAA